MIAVYGEFVGGDNALFEVAIIFQLLACKTEGSEEKGYSVGNAAVT
jgi:hypothetical protein